ncbi:MAG: N-acetylmuramoyl-L-alanine amidase [Chitinophagales bacterium]
MAGIFAFTPSALAATGAVTGTVVNVRSGPGTNYPVLNQLGQGTSVSILSSQNGWYQVQWGSGHQGWMSGQYIATSSGTSSGADFVANLRKTFLANASLINRVRPPTNPIPTQPPPSRGDVDRPPGGPDQIAIVIDPGHGGADTGATYFGANEKNLNLAMGLKLGETLKQAGYQVIYTRSNDTFISLANRSLTANTANADLFVSIHCNASTTKTLSGTTTYYTVSDNAVLNKERLQLATAVQSALVSNLRLADKGVRTEGFYVTRETTIPSILVETAFMSNNQDYAVLSNEEKQWVIARSIAQGITNYLSGK